MQDDVPQPLYYKKKMYDEKIYTCACATQLFYINNNYVSSISMVQLVKIAVIVKYESESESDVNDQTVKKNESAITHVEVYILNLNVSKVTSTVRKLDTNRFNQMPIMLRNEVK